MVGAADRDAAVQRGGVVRRRGAVHHPGRQVERVATLEPDRHAALGDLFLQRREGARLGRLSATISPRRLEKNATQVAAISWRLTSLVHVPMTKLLSWAKSPVRSRLKLLTVQSANIERKRRFVMQSSLGLSPSATESPSPRQPVPGVSSKQPSFPGAQQPATVVRPESEKRRQAASGMRVESCAQ